MQIIDTWRDLRAGQAEATDVNRACLFCFALGGAGFTMVAVALAGLLLV